MAKYQLGISKSVKAIKVGMYYKLDSAFYLWFRQQREKGISVTDPILLERATEFYRFLYSESPKPFNASYGYQWRFCNHFGIESLAITGKKVCANIVSADEFVSSMNKLTDGYSLNQVFNCNETGLFHKMLPGRTLIRSTAIHLGPKK